ncbi:MAG: enoyl-CoA hydratase/isomerase family protein [Chloroflexi bacterium]|nr:enoyl-CoA hydratase/isomerase family protein [Chloroflexota bacterium]
MPAVLYEVRNRIAYITLNRPEKMNAINPELSSGLVQALTNVRQDPEVWAAIITGAGDRAFCAGADLIRMEERTSGDSASQGRSEAANQDNLYQFIRHTYKPIIAAVNGYALAAGAGIVLSSDIRILSERAQLGWPHAKRGIGSVSGPVLLAHLVPINKAMEIEFYADFLSAAKCLELGLANAVVPHEELLAAATAAAEKILTNSPTSLRTIKEAAIRGLDLPMEERIKLATELNTRCMQSEDAKEGLRAFAEKRAPVWTGR